MPILQKPPAEFCCPFYQKKRFSQKHLLEEKSEGIKEMNNN
jgi:hypothetical protein